MRMFAILHKKCIDIKDIERIVAESVSYDITVIIDEAYGDFMPKENSAVQAVSILQKRLIPIRSAFCITTAVRST